MKRFSTLLLIMLLLNACGDQKIDTAKAKAEMEAREIKKVSEAEIVTEAMRLGKQVSRSFQVEISIEGDNKFKSVAFEKKGNYETDHYFLDQPNDLEGKALAIFEAYQYNGENDIKSEDVVQKLEDGDTFLYSKPSELNGKLVGVWTIRFQRKDLVLNIEK